MKRPGVLVPSVRTGHIPAHQRSTRGRLNSVEGTSTYQTRPCPHQKVSVVTSLVITEGDGSKQIVPSTAVMLVRIANLCLRILLKLPNCGSVSSEVILGR